MAEAGEDNREIDHLGRLIHAAKRIVVLTGAGISTESGIPDFRGPNGTWTRIRPITLQEFVASEEARLEDWRRRFAMNEAFAKAEPNAGHLGLARMAATGRLRVVITQNIDGLHQRAGLAAASLIEIHGNATHGRCLKCRAAMPLEEVRESIDRTGDSPRCSCGGLVKAAIVSFGERLPEDLLTRALDEAARADLFLVLGSSLQVQPAASLPMVAKRSGARVAVVNLQPTPLDPHADSVIREPIGGVFSRLFPQSVN